jgi:transposase InsO family protein
VFSDILEIKLANRTRVRDCFTLWKRTRHILGMAFEFHRRAECVTTALHTLAFEVPDTIFQSDQGKQCGAEHTRQLLLEKGFQLSMSRADTPTDTGYAERVVGLFKLAVAERCSSQTLGVFVRATQAWIPFSDGVRPHERLGFVSPDPFAREHGFPPVPSPTPL